MPPFALPKGPFAFGAPVLPKPPPRPVARPRPRPAPPPRPRPAPRVAPPPSPVRGVTGTAYAPSRAPARPVSGRVNVPQPVASQNRPVPVPPVVAQRLRQLESVRSDLARTRARAPAVAAAYAKAHPNDTLENLLWKATGYVTKPITILGKDLQREFSGQNYDAKGRPIGGGGPSGGMPGASITPLASASAETAKIGTN